MAACSVELVVPRLVPALSDPAPAASPCLHRWLSRAQLQRSACDSLEQALCERLSVARQEDWPVAPLALLADGVDPGADYWLRADPAHLQATRGDLVLAACGDLGQTQAEADALVASLNRHFAADAVPLCAVRAGRWYARTAQPQALRTVPPSAAMGRSVDPLLPCGEQALAWHRRLNEMQMLLHDHPVNAQREARGALPINSLWLWGGGRRPACQPATAFTIWSDDPLARGLALCSRAACSAAPPSAETWLRAAGAGEHLIVLDEPPASHAAGPDWLERLWLAPLLAAVRSGIVMRATLVTQSGASLWRLTVTRLDLWKFWRRAPSIEALTAEARGA
jgi:hypothetical protein